MASLSSSLTSTYLLKLMCILRLCNAIFLVKFGIVCRHYRLTMGGFTGHDPLNDASSQDWEIICAAAIKAKQFMGGYYDHFHKKQTRPQIELSEWDPALNMVGGEHQLSYKERAVRIRDREGEDMIKSLQCVGTMWFITYGGPGGYMYLLEPASRMARSRLRVTGLFEPSAKFKDKNTPYFFDQFRRPATKGNMMRSICGMNSTNRFRVCSSIYDILSKKHKLEIPQKNFIDTEKTCAKKVVVERSQFRGSAYFFPCATLITEDDARTQYSKIAFYVLADAREPGAVFVFFERPDEKLELHSQITDIGAYSQPVSSVHRGKRKKVQGDMEDSYQDTDEGEGAEDQLLEISSGEQL